METSSSKVTFWMPEKDPKGRPIAAELLEAAVQIWPRAKIHAERESYDSAIAAEVLEEAVIVVSNLLYRYGDHSVIRNLVTYLYSAFVRKLTRLAAKRKKLALIPSEGHEPIHSGWSGSQLSGVERKIFCEQVVSLMDARTRTTFFMRAGGQSWTEIAHALGISVNNAQVSYIYRMEKLRKRILLKSAKQLPKAKGKEV
jgi:DNA-directed RNA polymerase specialized sigma24 family protein